MTSMAAESVSTILVSCQQTRFHIESPNYREVSKPVPNDNPYDISSANTLVPGLQLDIEGLNITVTSADSGPKGTATAKAKGKAKASEGTEILSNAKLRLKAGSRYALIGRNGSGKSSAQPPLITLLSHVAC